jgi:hypothetical protein
VIFQAGLKLGAPPAEVDQLWFRHARIDEGAGDVEEVVTEGMAKRLRGLLRKYGTCFF